MSHASFIVVGFRFRNVTPNVMLTDLITLEEEPTNPIDSNAILVVVGQKHVGYVAAEFTDTIRHILRHYQRYEINVTCLYEASAKCTIYYSDEKGCTLS